MTKHFAFFIGKVANRELAGLQPVFTAATALKAGVSDRIAAQNNNEGAFQ